MTRRRFFGGMALLVLVSLVILLVEELNTPLSGIAMSGWSTIMVLVYIVASVVNSPVTVMLTCIAAVIIYVFVRSKGSRDHVPKPDENGQRR